MSKFGITGNVVSFPDDKRTAPEDARKRETIELFEAVLRERWSNVVNEPIPGRWLQLVSVLERIESERSLQPERSLDHAERTIAPRSMRPEAPSRQSL